MNTSQWLEHLAAKQATPGGGAAAGLAAAAAAALVGMVSIYTTGNKWADREAEMLQINEQAAQLRQRAQQLMNDDEIAFAAVGAAYALPSSDPSRESAIQAALLGAAQPPREVAILGTEIVTLAANLVNQANPNVVSDIAVAASLARAAIESAAVNIEVNAMLIVDQSIKDELFQAVDACNDAIKQAQLVVDIVRAKLRGVQG